MGKQNPLTESTQLIIDKMIRNQFTKRIFVIKVFLLHLHDAFSMIFRHGLFIDISVDAHTRGQALVLHGKALVTGDSRRTAVGLRNKIDCVLSFGPIL